MHTQTRTHSLTHTHARSNAHIQPEQMRDISANDVWKVVCWCRCCWWCVYVCVRVLNKNLYSTLQYKTKIYRIAACTPNIPTQCDVCVAHQLSGLYARFHRNSIENNQPHTPNQRRMNKHTRAHPSPLRDPFANVHSARDFRRNVGNHAIFGGNGELFENGFQIERAKRFRWNKQIIYFQMNKPK